MVPRAAAHEFTGVINFRDRAVARFQTDLVKAADRLETRIREFVQEFTVADGSFVGDERTLAKLARTQRFLEEELRDTGYQRRANLLIRQRDDLRKRSTAAFRKVVGAGSFSDPDLTAFRLASAAQFDAYANIGGLGVSSIREGLQRAVTGEQSFEAWSQGLRELLHGTGRVDKRGAGMFRHASTLADTSMSQLHRTMDAKLADDAEIALFEYHGPGDARVRPFCRGLMRQAEDGKIWTRAEIEGLDNGRPGGGGSGPGTAFTQGGGWNCRHSWIPVTDDMVADAMPRIVRTIEPDSPIREELKLAHLNQLPQGEFGSLMRDGLPIRAFDASGQSPAGGMHEVFAVSSRARRAVAGGGKRRIREVNVVARRPLQVDAADWDDFWKGRSTKRAHLEVYENLIVPTKTPTRASVGRAVTRSGFDAVYKRAAPGVAADAETSSIVLMDRGRQIKAVTKGKPRARRPRPAPKAPVARPPAPPTPAPVAPKPKPARKPVAPDDVPFQLDPDGHKLITDADIDVIRRVEARAATAKIDDLDESFAYARAKLHQDGVRAPAEVKKEIRGILSSVERDREIVRYREELMGFLRRQNADGNSWRDTPGAKRLLQQQQTDTSRRFQIRALGDLLPKSLTENRSFQKIKLSISRKRGRAYATSGRDVAGQNLIQLWSNSSRRSLFHEFGHHIEYRNAHVAERIRQWFGRRIARDMDRGVGPRPWDSGHPSELAWWDDFANKYIGRIYDKTVPVKVSAAGRTVDVPGVDPRFQFGATEIMAMGIETFAHERRFRTMLLDDPEHLDLIISILTGR